MKGRLQEKNGYWYVVIARGGGLTPKWIRTGLKVENNKRKAEKMVSRIVADYETQCNREAADKEPQSNIVISAPAPSDAQNPLFTEIIEVYLSTAKLNVKINTYEKYHYAAHNHIIPWFEQQGTRLQNLTTLKLQEYYSGKITSGLSKESVKYHKTVINQTLKYAIFPMKLITNNPAAGISLGKSPDANICFYDTDQLKELLSRIAGMGNQIEAPVILAAYYGLRRSEALGLQWPAIDFKKKTVLICRTAIKTSSGTVYAKTVKSKSSLRTMPLFPEVEVYLKELYRQQQEMRSLMKKSYKNNPEVCKWDDGRLVRPDYVTHRFHELIKEFGMPPLTFHQLRHSTASLLINKGHSLKEVQEWLGHADPRSTNVYAHMLYKSKENMAASIGGSLLTPETPSTSQFSDM